MGDLAVADTGGLDYAVTGLEQHLSDIGILEAHPSPEHEDELETQFMGVPLRLRSLAGDGADDVGGVGAAGGLPRAEVAIGEEAAQAGIVLGLPSWPPGIAVMRRRGLPGRRAAASLRRA
jgi:hypothetical protein